MNKVLRAAGITILALAIGMGGSACTSKDPQGSRPSVSGTATIAPPASSNADTAEVKKALDGFFEAIARDTAAFKAERESADPNEPKLTSEQQVEKIRDAYAASFEYLDFPSMGLTKSMDLIGWAARPLSQAPQLSISANEEGISVDGDKATVNGEHLTIRANEAGDVTGSKYSPGTIHMTRIEGRWLVTDYMPNMATEMAPVEPPVE